MPYDVDAIRKKIKQAQSGKFSDPDEFRPEKAKDAQIPVAYRFFILPPFMAGEKIKGGPAKTGMDNQFYITHGNHWVSDKPYPCPRVWSGDKCPICDFGFQLLKDEKISKDDEKRRNVVKQWMPNQQYMMNIFFPVDKKNPEDLHNKVMFYNAPKTVLDICTAALMRDDPGDPESPEAFGAFFDESNAFLFELQVLKQGKQNSYKTSKFLTTPRAMIRNADGSANEKALAKLLESRHDLFSKVQAPDMGNIQRVFDLMVNGDDSADDKKKGGGFDEDETGDSKPAKTTVATGGSTPPAGKRDTGTVQTSKATTTTRKPPVDDDDEDDAAAALARANATKAPPVAGDDDEDDAPPVKKPAATTQKVTKAAVPDDLADEAPLDEKPAPAKKGGSDEASPEIDNLLSQLEDDDS